MISYSKIKKFCKDNSSLILFLVFFVIYFTSGLYITFLNNSITQQFDIIFGTDCPRVFHDFLNVYADHYRTKVHPLQLILLQPLFLIVNAFLHSPKAALLMVQALCSASVVCLIKNILSLWTHNNKLSILISVIYGLSFSALIFTSIPETYIFATLSNALLYHYNSLLAKKETSLALTNYIVIALLTVFSFGIIPVSFIPNLILILCLLKNKLTVKNFLKIFCLMLTLYISFTFIQKVGYPNSPTFFKNAAKEDINYTDFNINLKKINYVAKGIFIESFYALKCKQYEHPERPNGLLKFDKEQKFVSFIPSISIFVLMLFCIVSKYGYFSKEKYPIGCLALILAANFIQLYFYGANESFLYSQNSLFYLTILLGLAFSPIKITSPVCILFTLYQIAVNIPAISIVEQHARLGTLKHYHWSIWLLYAIISALAIYLINILLKKILNKELPELSTEKKYAYYLGIFTVFIIINCIFLALFHGRVE